MKYAIQIGGMHCAHCAKAIEKALGAIAGVTAVSIDLAGEKAYATSTTALDEDTVADTIEDIGFDFVSMETKEI